jgi:hypothetical protein
MRKLLTFLLVFLTIGMFGQMSSEVKTPELYVEPQSIQSVKDVWVSDKDDNRKVGLTMVIGGLAVVGLDLYEGKEAWKRPTSNGWVYRPFITQSTRPIMMLTGVALTGTGLGIMLYNR